MADLESPQFDDELLSAYLDDELSTEERARVEERLSSDPAARQLLDELRTVSRAMKELPAATLGADLRESVLRRAERAMLVSGGRDSDSPARGDSGYVPAFPIGRSKRAWFWAATALAAGLLLMIFQRPPAKNGDLPQQVAQGDRNKLVRNEPLPPLQMRALEPAKDDLAAARNDSLAESVPLSSNARPHSSEPERVAATSESDSTVRLRAAAPAGGVSGLDGSGPQSELAVESRGRFVETLGDELLVVHVDVKPEAMRSGAFNALLNKNQIQFEDSADEKSKAGEPQDVEVVVVDAAPAQMLSTLSDLKQDDKNFSAVCVDDRLATSQRALVEKQSAADFTQFNRGNVQNQQQPELAANNTYFYKTNRGTVEIEQKLGRQIEEAVAPAAGTELSFETQGRASSAVPLARKPEVGFESVDSYGVTAESNAASAQRDLTDTLQPNVARRAMQKLEAKADTWQALFVLTCPSHPASQAAASAADQAPAAPASGAPAQEGLNSDER